MNVLLISPETLITFWSFKHAIRFASRKAAFPPLGLLTLAAMLPREWNLRVVDVEVDRLFDADILWADYVMISAICPKGLRRPNSGAVSPEGADRHRRRSSLYDGRPGVCRSGARRAW